MPRKTELKRLEIVYLNGESDLYVLGGFLDDTDDIVARIYDNRNPNGIFAVDIKKKNGEYYHFDVPIYQARRVCRDYLEESMIEYMAKMDESRPKTNPKRKTGKKSKDD